MTSPLPDPGVFISTAQMYAQLQGVNETVQRMDAKLDALATQSAQLADHEGRLRHLEERRLPQSTLSWLSLAIAAVVGVLSLVVPLIGHK
jgi:hypothetical protein